MDLSLARALLEMASGFRLTRLEEATAVAMV
jgi:hypothetical protein